LTLLPMPAQLVRAVVAENWPAVGRLLAAEFPEEWRFGAWSWLPRWLHSLDEEADLALWGPHLLLLRNEDGSSTVVGEAGFHGRPEPDGIAEFGYMTVSVHRRRGYAEEAMRALLRWAVAEPGVEAFRATVAPGNAASIALLTKLGLAATGRHRHPERGEELIFQAGAKVMR
jgi:RimJ/RimL family protein N-acetyltransferase